MRRHPVLVAVPALMLAGGIRAGNAVPGATANNHPVYTALRTVGIGDGYQVDDLVLNRDAATFALTGSVYLLSPVQGRSTGAVFIGEGTMAYTPPLEVEVAHLWWGHALGWDSYRDQWMSEGFSNLSASIFLQTAYPKEPQRFREFWRGMLDSLVEKNAAGVRPIDVGPVTQGFRLSSDWTGGAADAVLYAKGAYILHMLRMMIWTHEEADGKFKAMLRDFVGTHRNRPVSTADFRAIVEKHMVPGMDVEGNGSMNCFFRQYVEGTSLPTYRFQHSVSKRDGQAVLAVRISQSDVHESFVMPVPLYVELEDGRIIRLGSVTLRGNTTIEQSIPLGLLPVKRAMLNYYYDVQAREER